jgi:hypothetical protein
MSSTRGGLAETWAMVWAKRARKAETPKQPSLCLMLRAPYFYPTLLPAGGAATCKDSRYKGKTEAVRGFRSGA